MTADSIYIGETHPALTQRRLRTSVLLGIATVPLVAAALLLGHQMHQPWPARYYLAVHVSAETLVTVVAFATFAVQWYAAGARLNDARARFIGSAFLAVSLLEIAHTLAFPGMPGLVWLDSSTERGIVYWISARLWTVLALLAAAAIPPDSKSRALRRDVLLAWTIAGVVTVLAVDYLWISRRPVFFVEGIGLTPLKKGLEALVAAAALVGAAVYRKIARKRGDRSAADLSAALWLTVLSELCFTLYARAYDSFNLLGHVYLLLASYGVFHALFSDAVLRPYERLGAASRELAASNDQLKSLQRHVEEELAVTIRNLESLQVQREDLLRAVSHDLRTPLQIVLLQAERLSRCGGDAARTVNAAQSIIAAGRQMAAMIQDLVDSVHLESGTVKVAPQTLSLPAFVADLVHVARGPLDTGRVVLELPEDLPEVEADPTRLARVVQNLLGNALKYSAPGTPVAVRASASEDEIAISVADRGAGIPAEHVPHLFERFYRGEHSGKSDGLGLGLYISRMIVEAHGGRIWCESEAGRGSTFNFTLPLATAGQGARAGEAPRA
ncbi:MAG TPA: MASE3 domain-containing protein [Anaeromyxobacteraceae bacterium]|nr:MASE3 domain-containing protein [Anaeromyxobacteraceae bacterium]